MVYRNRKINDHSHERRIVTRGARPLLDKCIVLLIGLVCERLIVVSNTHTRYC